MSERQFYRDLIRVADMRFDAHLKKLPETEANDDGELDDFMKDFTPEGAEWPRAWRSWSRRS